MHQLIKRLDRLISKRGPYGTIPTRQYQPAGQKPIALKCPGGEHAHGGFPYCHPEQRKHRIAARQFHEEKERLAVLEHHMNRIGDAMLDIAKRKGKKAVPGRMRDDFKRIYTYLQRMKGTRRKLPTRRG